MPAPLPTAGRSTVHSGQHADRADRPPRGSAALPYAVAAALFAAYTAVSVSRHGSLRTTAYDLGIFTQAVRGYAELRAPTADLKGPGFNLLGDHFHPILAGLAPLYRVFPDPVTLLVAQAALLAWSAVPITRLAVRAIGPVGGGCLGVAYGLAWGLQQAVGFDFHEVCFAVPLLAMSLERLATERWAAAVAWAAPLVLVKEDLPATVAAIGGYLLLRRQWRLGAATVLGAVAAGVLVVGLAIPAVNPTHSYRYAAVAAPTGDHPLVRLLTPDVKLWTLVLLLAPSGFVALRSGLLAVALPTILWRFWSANPNYWGVEFHYSAVLMPIVFVAFVDVLGRLATADRLVVRRLARLAGPCAAAGALIATPHLPLGALAAPATLLPDARAGAARAVLGEVPDGATVAATNRLAPHLVPRCRVLLFPRHPTPDSSPEWVPEWIVAGDPPDDSLGPPERTAARLAEMRNLGYRVVTRRAGVIVLRRP